MVVLRAEFTGNKKAKRDLDSLLRSVENHDSYPILSWDVLSSPKGKRIFYEFDMYSDSNRPDAARSALLEKGIDSAKYFGKGIYINNSCSKKKPQT